MDASYETLFPDDIDLNRVIYDGAPLLVDSAFWVSHLLAQGFDEDEELILDAFEVDEDRVGGIYQTLTNIEAWPVFTVSLPKGSDNLWVVYRNVEGDAGVDYVMGRADAPVGSGTRLAALEGGFVGPGMRWSEAAQVANGGGVEGLTWAQRLLLISPMCSDRDGGQRAVGLVESALREVGAAANAEELARILVESHPMWDLPSWVSDENGIVICDGRYSPRNPDSPNALDYSAVSAISHALNLS